MRTALFNHACNYAASPKPGVSEKEKRLCANVIRPFRTVCAQTGSLFLRKLALFMHNVRKRISPKLLAACYQGYELGERLDTVEKAGVVEV